MSLARYFEEPMDYFRPSRRSVLSLNDDDDLLGALLAPRRLRRSLLSAPYTRNWPSLIAPSDKDTSVVLDKDKFQVSVDVQQFSPEEITVKATGDNTITVEGKHEEREDEHGYISRHFVRRYTLPKGHSIDKVQSKLSSDGVLTITAPKENAAIKERDIPIALTGKPSKEAIMPAPSGDSTEKMEVCEKEPKKDTKKRK